jgi:hypothetical protein
MSWDLPQEDEFALCNLGVPSPYATIAFPNEQPQNEGYLELDQLPRRARQQWKQSFLYFLKQLHSRRAGRIVLKSPTHTFRLPTLLELFPNARFVHMVRHPVAVFLSTVRLWKSLYATHGYQKPCFAGLEETVFAKFLRMHERLQNTRDLVPRGHLIDVKYEDLANSTVEQMEVVYAQLDLGNFQPVRSQIEAYVADHADYQPNRYQPTTDQQREIHRRWKPYFERYGYLAST